MSRGKGKILVIRGGAIGDFILTLPVLSAVRDQFPEADLEVLGYPHVAQIAVEGGLADAVRSIEARALAGYFAKDGALDPTLGKYFSSFGLIISFLYDPDEIFRENVRRVTRAQFITGPHRPPAEAKVHATQVFLEPLERLAIFGPDPVPTLTFGPGDTGLPRVGTWFAAHPGSGSERKNWPEAKWAGLLEQLRERENANLLLIGGEAEGDRLERLARVWPPERLRVAKSLPLAELGRLLQHCAIYAGHDSGISHLAAAVGLGGVILWGETNAEIWRPLSARMEIVRAGSGLADLKVEQVLAALAGRW